MPGRADRRRRAHRRHRDRREGAEARHPHHRRRSAALSLDVATPCAGWAPAPPAAARSPTASRSRRPARLTTRDRGERSSTRSCWSTRTTIEHAVMQLLDGARRSWPKARAPPARGDAGATASASPGKRVGTVICGGNIDARMLAHDPDARPRARRPHGRACASRSPTSRACSARLAGVIGKAGGNIIEIYHQRLFHDVPVEARRHRRRWSRPATPSMCARSCRG